MNEPVDVEARAATRPATLAILQDRCGFAPGSYSSATVDVITDTVIAAYLSKLAEQGLSVQPAIAVAKAMAFEDVTGELVRHQRTRNRGESTYSDGFLGGIGAALGYMQGFYAKHLDRINKEQG